jgi:HD-GYP domain-containing protein (c-di-GMP phosphodiesterase class II)/HAMP domain-containing protein
MNANAKTKIDGLAETSLYRKFSIAFVFMSLVPIILILYIINFLNLTPIIEKQLPFFKLTILLVVLLSLASFDLIRRSMVALSSFSSNAKQIASGNYSQKVKVSDEGEIGDLANSFNTLTDELQNKIKELESSKKLLQNVLNKIGSAVTSTKGIKNLLELILEALANGIDTRSGAIFLSEEGKSGFMMRAGYNMPDNLRKANIYPEKGLINRVIEFKKLEIASDLSTNADAYFEYRKNLAKDSIMAAPLIYKDRVHGVVVVCDKISHKTFSKDDIILLSNVTAQLAIAIENHELNQDAEKTYLETITALAVAVEAKDRYSKGHLDRVGDYVERIGKEMNLDNKTMKTLKSGAILHDIGKIGIRDEVLQKKGPLTEEEFEEMKQHTIIGVNIIKPIRSMSALCDLVRYHQELYDGSGYPDGLKGEEIPLTARILKICDAYDAMTTDRPYHKAMSKEEAKKEIKAKSGIDFDPEITEKFLKII